MEKCRGFERARVEHCPKCHSTSTRNNMYFCRGQEIRVYIECADCGGFVARYTLSGYTSDKTYESLLRRLHLDKLKSGKRKMKMVEPFGDDVREEFEHVLRLIKTDEDARVIEEIIEKDMSDLSG